MTDKIILEQDEEFLEDFEGQQGSGRKLSAKTIGKAGPGGGIAGKNNPDGKGNKRVGSDQTITKPGEAPPKAPVKKIAKPAKTKQDPKLPSKTPGSKIGTEKEPEKERSDNQKNKNFLKMLESLNKKIGIQLKGGKGESFGPKVPEAFHRDALLRMKKQIKKAGLGNQAKALRESSYFLNLENDFYMAFWGTGRKDSKYYTGNVGQVRSILHRATDLLSGEKDYIQGLVKVMALTEATEPLVDEFPKKSIDFLDFLNDVNKKIEEVDKGLSEHLKSNISDEEYDRFWHAFFAEYEKVIKDNMEKTFNVLQNKQNSKNQRVVNQPARPVKESNIMKREDIRSLIREAFTDKVYGKYPYSHKSGEEGEPAEDYMEDWKRFCLEIIQDKSGNKAIEVAKVLIKDLELFEDVLDLAGANQSIGSEIMKKMEKTDKDMI